MIRRKSYALACQTVDEAVADLELLDYDFHLFTEKATSEDSVVYRTPDGYRLAQARSRPHRPITADVPITISEHPAPRLAAHEAITRAAGFAGHHHPSGCDAPGGGEADD